MPRRAAHRSAALAVLAALVSTAAASTASAHLMAPRHATVHVLGQSVYSVVWLPASAFRDVEIDAAGLVNQADLARRQPALVEQLQRRWTLRDGDEQAATVRLDLILQPTDDAPPERADQVVMLHHARFSRAPRSVEVDTDLFGDASSDPSLEVTATRDAESEIATLRPRQGNHRFFAPSRAAAATSRPRAPLLAWGAAACVLGLLVLVIASRRRRALPMSAVGVAST